MNGICEQCLRKAQSMTPGYFGMLHEKPGIDNRFDSIQELKTAVESDRVSMVFVRALRPVDQTFCEHEIRIPLKKINESTSEEIEKLVFDELAMQLELAIHHEHSSADPA